MHAKKAFGGFLPFLSPEARLFIFVLSSFSVSGSPASSSFTISLFCISSWFDPGLAFHPCSVFHLPLQLRFIIIKLIINSLRLARKRGQNGEKAFTKGAYFIGKMIWTKGYKEPFQHLRNHQKELSGLEIDLFGTGEDSDEVQKAAKKLEQLTVRVHPACDHADALIHE
ncbi:hypothetical protein RJT34_17919 [Clitoria ternatea]|uniref:Uncharacterized protein n=1 Tax=Clitoria ternatea TaxID=43366 RepID=A0AAN9JB51_CLITE